MSIKSKKIIYIGLCFFGGGLVGFFANQLNELTSKSWMYINELPPY